MFALVFGFKFVIWIFPELSILVISWQIYDLCDFPFTVLVKDLEFSVNILGAVVWMLFVDPFCWILVLFDRFQLSAVFYYFWNFG